ncbi:MAG: response regulator transcription factor [Gemmatimonadaceae bacterium]|nr:response regulator transcription factor [Gemmatimonadaceae bacterium]
MAAISVLCFDDNELLTEALGIRLTLDPRITWLPPHHRLDGAVATITALAPDIVLLDLSLPGTDQPLDVIAALRRQGAPSRVIVITGHPGSAARTAALDAGAAGFVSKLITPDRLLDVLHRVHAGEVVMDIAS